MSIIKNLKVSKKLGLIIIPAIVSLIVLMALFIYRSNSTVQESKKALYDEVFVSTAAILNADRDFYQAAIAEKELVMSGDNIAADRKVQLVKDYNENMAQTIERMNAAIDNIKGNKALYIEFKHPTENVSLEQLGTAFQTEFKAWQEAYNPENGTGDVSAKLVAFAKTRGEINLMTELLEKYADKRSRDIKEQVKDSIIVSMTIISIIIFIITILAVVIVSYLKKNIRYVTDISQRIAQGELSIQIDEKKITRDEIGQLCEATGRILQRLNGYVTYINEITEVLNTMAEGDMRVSLQNDYTGEFSSINRHS